jgi:hypothetical protein
LYHLRLTTITGRDPPCSEPSTMLDRLERVTTTHFNENDKNG